MKKTNLIFTVFLMIFAVSYAAAQNPTPPAGEFVSNDEPEDDQPLRRGEIIARELGLTPEQAKEIREINQQRRPLMQEARRKLKIANDELNELIYSDTIDELSLQTKIRAVAEAQAEITKIRALTEVAARNVLTPEQLEIFRRLQLQFTNQQQMRQQRRQNRRQMNQRNQNQRTRPLPNRNRRN
jgi:periplasmic protein CpxP/Spy